MTSNLEIDGVASKTLATRDVDSTHSLDTSALVYSILSKSDYGSFTTTQLLALADLALQANISEVATLALQEIIGRGDKAHLAYYRMGRMFLRLGEPEKAREFFDLGTAADKQFPHNYMGAARARHAMGRKADAAPLAIRFIKFGVRPHDNNDFAVLSDVADWLLADGHQDKAARLSLFTKLFDAEKILRTKYRLTSIKPPAKASRERKEIRTDSPLPSPATPSSLDDSGLILQRKGPHDTYLIDISESAPNSGGATSNPGFSRRILDQTKLQSDLEVVLLRHRLVPPSEGSPLAHDLTTYLRHRLAAAPSRKAVATTELVANPSLSSEKTTHPSSAAETLVSGTKKVNVAHLQGRERWVSGRGENPAAFIRRVYADVLATKTLTRAHLRQIDRTLYNSYGSWITPKRHPEDDLELPITEAPLFTSAEEELAHKKTLKRNTMKRLRMTKRGTTLAL